MNSRHSCFAVFFILIMSTSVLAQTTPDTWGTRASIPGTVHYGGSLVQAGSYIYAFRGSNGTQFYRYDDNANSWTTMWPSASK